MKTLNNFTLKTYAWLPYKIYLRHAHRRELIIHFEGVTTTCRGSDHKKQTHINTWHATLPVYNIVNN
jgi:hypothetical protein